MKVVLNQDVKSVGKKLQIVEVSEGYARNFLIPKKLAKLLDNKTMNETKGKIDSIKHKKDEDVKNSNIIKEKIEKTFIRIKVKVGSNGKIFGSVTEKDIAENIKEKLQLTVDKKKIIIEPPIKEIGEHTVKLKLAEGITAKLKISVVKL